MDAQVQDLREEVAKLRSDVAQLNRNQLAILDALQAFQDALANHTHDDEGRAQLSLTR